MSSDDYCEVGAMNLREDLACLLADRVLPFLAEGRRVYVQADWVDGPTVLLANGGPEDITLVDSEHDVLYVDFDDDCIRIDTQCAGVVSEFADYPFDYFTVDFEALVALVVKLRGWGD